MSEDREDQYALENHGRIIALEMLLRSIYAEAALQSADPVAFTFDQVEKICSSIDRRSYPSDEEQIIVGKTQDYLRQFEMNVRERVKGEIDRMNGR